jgi:hypothetical protein
MLRYCGHGRRAISEDPEQAELGDGQVVFSRYPSQGIVDSKAELYQGIHQFRRLGGVPFGAHCAMVVELLCGAKYMIGATK